MNQDQHTTPYTFAASRHFGQANADWNNERNTGGVDHVVESMTWAVNSGYLEPQSCFLPDLADVLASDDTMARAYCDQFGVSVPEFSESHETDMDPD